jgi:hypothetical protein
MNGNVFIFLLIRGLSMHQDARGFEKAYFSKLCKRYNHIVLPFMVDDPLIFTGRDL